MKSFHHKIPGLLSSCVKVSALTMLLSTAAQAEALIGQASTTEIADVADDEIIVTAQRRSQTLTDVGLSITTASGSELAAAGVVDTSDLARITPGLTYARSAAGTPLFTLRGIGFNDYTLGASSAVSVYVNEVPLAYSVFTKGAVLDLERVEVLKGAQGLLFGQNSTGGAINYVAAQPTQDFTAGFNMSFGRFSAFEGTAYISGPLSDTLSARLAIGATRSGDWQTNYTRDDSIGSQDLLRGRFQLLWEPSSSVRFLVGANGWRDRSDTQAAQLVGLQLQRTVGSGPTAAEVNRRIAAIRAAPFAPANARAANWDLNRRLEHDDYFVQGWIRSDIDIGGNFSLASLTNFARYSEDYLLDRDGSTLQLAGVNSVGSVRSFGQELRLSYDAPGFNGVVGANYVRNDVENTINVRTDDLTNTVILLDFPLRSNFNETTQDIREYAAFAHAELEIASGFTALAGIRYTTTENRFTGCTYGDVAPTLTFFSSNFSGSPTPAIGPTECASLGLDFKPTIQPFEDVLDEDNLSWRVGLNYNPDRTSLVYASISRGYKSGSFPNLSATSVRQFTPVTQESVTAYEIGFRTNISGSRLRLSGAVFQYDYDDKQIRSKITDPIFNLLEALVNVPRSRSRGFELEVQATPFRGLTLNAAATYLDTEILEFVGINETGIADNFAGSRLPYSPAWQATGRADYQWALSDSLTASIGLNVTHNSRTNSALGEPAATTIRPFTTIDVRAGLETDSGWRFSVWGRNVTNANYWNNAFNVQDVIVRYAARPVTYGVALGYDF